MALALLQLESATSVAQSAGIAPIITKNVKYANLPLELTNQEPVDPVLISIAKPAN
jgi:hypothetical protein